MAAERAGDTFRVHCREWFDGAIVNDDSAEDVLNAPLKTVHKLSGPFAVQGAKPGNLLVVDILDVGPVPQEDSGLLAGQGWGYTGIFARSNGGGFLTDRFPDAYKAVWDFRGRTATSRHVPEVSSTGIVHPGLMGTAPSAELLARWNAREGALIATDPDRAPPLGLPPEPEDALLDGVPGPDVERVAAEAARTAPPRENGGNQDIKNPTKGTRAFYPVFVDGAIFAPGNTDPQYSGWISISGTSVTLDGERRYLDAQLSCRRACLHAIDYLMKFGYSPEQAYQLLGAAPIEGRFSGVVDIPDSCATVYLPTAIFDFDIRPSAAGPHQVDPGAGAPRAAA